MDRLTETNNYIGFMETYLNINCDECQYKNTEECKEYKDECKAVAGFKKFVQAMYSKLKYYEDLEEQRKLLKLPCMVGDTVYQNMIVGVDKDKKLIYEIDEAKVFKFSLDSYTLCFWTETIINQKKYQNEFSLSAFGETVFSAKEEAEAALNDYKIRKG